MRRKLPLPRHRLLEMARKPRVIARQAEYAARFAEPGTQHVHDHVHENEARGERKMPPLAHVVIRSVQIQAEITDRGQPSAVPQARLDVGRHHAGDRRVMRHLVEVTQHVTPRPLVLDHGLNADDDVFHATRNGDEISRATLAKAEHPRARHANVVAAIAEQHCVIARGRRLDPGYRHAELDGCPARSAMACGRFCPIDVRRPGGGVAQCRM